MIIFLRKIPANTRKSEIISFIEPAVFGGFFQKSGEILDIKILVLKDLQINALEFHGLVTVDSNITARRAIKILNRKVFNGKNIAVREYIERTWHNDPRINFKQKKKKLLNRRKADRRRTRLEVLSDISDQFSSSEGFHRTL